MGRFILRSGQSFLMGILQITSVCHAALSEADQRDFLFHDVFCCVDLFLVYHAPFLQNHVYSSQ